MEGVDDYSNKPNTDVLGEIERCTKMFFPKVIKTPVLALFCIPGELGIRTFLAQPADGAIASLCTAYMGVCNYGGRVDEEWMALFKKVVSHPHGHDTLLPTILPAINEDTKSAISEIKAIMNAQIEKATKETSYLLVYMNGPIMVVEGGATAEDVYMFPIIPLLLLIFSSKQSDPPYLQNLTSALFISDHLNGISNEVDLFEAIKVRHTKKPRPKIVADDDDEIQLESMDVSE